MVKNDPKVIIKLLRAIASGTDAQNTKQDVIFSAAANMLEQFDRDTARCHMTNKSEA